MKQKEYFCLCVFFVDDDVKQEEEEEEEKKRETMETEKSIDYHKKYQARRFRCIYY